MKTAEELTNLFRSRGRKATPQRESIFRALHATDGCHPSAEAIYVAVVDELPMVSRKTVYQTLHDLVALGELTHLDLGSGPARFDVNVEPHQHLVCDGCGRTWDVHAEIANLQLPASIREFAIETTQIVFRGRCATCVDSALSENR